MRCCSEDAPRTGKRNVNLNKNASENAALNKMFYPDERAPSFIFKHFSFCYYISLRNNIEHFLEAPMYSRLITLCQSCKRAD